MCRSKSTLVKKQHGQKGHLQKSTLILLSVSSNRFPSLGLSNAMGMLKNISAWAVLEPVF
jgi:hypothetical protein